VVSPEPLDRGPRALDSFGAAPEPGEDPSALNVEVGEIRRVCRVTEQPLRLFEVRERVLRPPLRSEDPGDKDVRAGKVQRVVRRLEERSRATCVLERLE
jgi:hypothetical protein